LAGVIETEAGDPITGASVRLTERWHNRSVETGETGAFVFDRLPNRPIWVRVDAPAHPPHFVILEASGGKTAHRIALSPGGRLRGVVLDADDRSVAAGTLMISWDVTHPLDRDLDRLRVTHRLRTDGTLDVRLQPGTYRLRAYGPKWLSPAESRVEIRAGETTDFRLRGAPPRDGVAKGEAIPLDSLTLSRRR
jgi:hypothetical protein